jgi:hypothetical protein
MSVLLARQHYKSSELVHQAAVKSHRLVASYIHYSSLLSQADATNIPPSDHWAVCISPWSEFYLCDRLTRLVWGCLETLQHYLEENQIVSAITMIHGGNSRM